MADDRLNRHALTDSERALVEPLLPAHPRQGHRWNDHRVVINGIFFRTRAGCPWRGLPLEYGDRKNLYNRHRPLSGDRTREKNLGGLLAPGSQAESRPGTGFVESLLGR